MKKYYLPLIFISAIAYGASQTVELGPTVGGGGGTTSPLTTKGDIWGYSTTNARIPACPNGQHLAYDSSQTLGVICESAGGGGTVTSVDMTVPSFLNVSGNPITMSGTLAVTLATETANTVFSGPASGGAVTPTFRALVSADIPALSYVTSVGTGTGLTGGPITSTGTISLANTAVTPGSYTNTSLTVDAQGRLTAASNGIAAHSYLQFSSGPLASPNITAIQRMQAGKTIGAITIQNIEATASQFVGCATNPTIIIEDCGTTAACTSPVTNATVTLTALDTITDGTVPTPTIAATHYWAIALSAGDCDSLNFAVTADIIVQ